MPFNLAACWSGEAMTTESGRLDRYQHHLGDSEGWGGEPTETTK